MLKHLFSKFDWHSVARHQRDQLVAEVRQYDPNKLLNTSVEDLCSYLEAKYRVNVPVINDDEIVADQHEVTSEVQDYGRVIRVTDTMVEITVPFQGDSPAFNVQPTTFSMNPPQGEIHEDHLVLKFRVRGADADRMRSEIARTLNEIRGLLGVLRKDAEVLNSELRAIASTAIEQRRAKLLGDRQLTASLGFKMKERKESPRTYAAPEVKRKLSPVSPKASVAAFAPEPAMSEDDYNHILNVIQNMAQVMERSPSAFATMDEQALRSHFLVQLNGHYEGQATGETFNYEGKTDILVRSEGKNIFIAECKFWDGPKKFLETLDQLLSYSSWRDTKVAVIVFNRNRDFTNVLKSIRETTAMHTNFKRATSINTETSFRYVFGNRDDVNREMTVTVLAFDVPT